MQEGYSMKFDNLRLVNAVHKRMISHNIFLAGIYKDNMDLCQWEPEVFPGLLYRPLNLKGAVRMFDTGYLIFMGVKTIEIFEALLTHTLALVANYVDNNLPERKLRYKYRIACKKRVMEELMKSKQT
jgi:transcription initiation factor TFIID TATA-box-binding protein